MRMTAPPLKIRLSTTVKTNIYTHLTLPWPHPTHECIYPLTSHKTRMTHPRELGLV